MKNPRCVRAAQFVVASWVLTGFASSQEHAAAPELGQGLSSAQEEMIRLFHEVEQTLGAIDVELADAGAGRIPVPEGRDSGMDRLLHSTGEKSDQAVVGIDRILELAQEMNQGGSCMRSAMCNKPNQSGKSPLDKERQNGPTESEKTPEGPQDKPKPEGMKPEPQPQGEKPDDRGKNPPAGQNVHALPRSDESGPPVAPGSDAERWGMLPERVQQVFNNQITDDMPLQYRDWIDAYYKRLNGGR